MLGVAQHLQIHVFDIGVVLVVIAEHQAHLAVVIGEGHFLQSLAPALPPEPRASGTTALQQGEVMDIGDHRALDLHRVILLGFRAEVGQMITGKIDPANERDQTVDHHDLAVQTAEPVGADAQVLGRRIEDLQMHAGIAQC